MIVRRLAYTLSLICLAILMTANAGAGYITYRTSAANTDSNDASGDLPTINLLGAVPTLVYSPDVYGTNADYGFFARSCPACANNANDQRTGATFGAFGMDMESYDPARGSAFDGAAYRDFTTIMVSWAGQQSRPETKRTTPAVASHSGDSPRPAGQTTVQESIVTSKPAAFALIGGGLIALSLLGWKKTRR